MKGGECAMKKKGFLAALIALLLGLGATKASDAQGKQNGCCPACSPPEICCCK